jgi:5-oxoprolinase (ATP-hydrolysing)
VFDFEGTGPEVYANINAPEAVTYSAIIYCLRCLIDQDIPLNQGCLKPIEVRIPKGCFLSPSEKAAVVGGNVLTSQRVTDVVFKCFEACAASQGDCNNLTFGYGGNVAGGKEEKGFGYYETIAGGSGAGRDWEGTSGVHTHMTNTRITDAEVFERRYPVVLRRFELRPGSGGVGQHRGGDGVIRDIEFRIPVQVSILSERRVYRPYGLHGGGDAQCGKNIWVRRVNKMQGKGKGGEHEGQRREGTDEDEYEERYVSMGAKNTASMQPGERIIVVSRILLEARNVLTVSQCTPGGGGYGTPKDEKKLKPKEDHERKWAKGSVASRIAEWESSS